MLYTTTRFGFFRLVDKLFPQVVKWDSEEEASFYKQNGFKLKVKKKKKKRITSIEDVRVRVGLRRG